MDKSHTAETPDGDPREGDRREETTVRDLVDDYLWEEFGFGVAELEERHGERAPTDWADDCPSETVEAVAPNEVTAGVHVERVDVDAEFDDMPFMVRLRQHFPPEDDREGETVAMHGEHAVLQTIAALAELTSGRFEEVPWDDA